MSLRNYSKFKKLVYSYLDYREISESEEINLLIEECLKEIEDINSFEYRYQEFDYIIEPINKEPYLDFLYGCEGYYISAMTLGATIDQRIKFYSINNLLKMYVFDACSSAYLEYKSDEYEESLGDNLTFRFCPGYGESSLDDIRPLGELLKITKMGIQILPSGLMIPQKTMIGIIGKNKNTKKNCIKCINKNNCKYIKEGRTCYN